MTKWRRTRTPVGLGTTPGRQAANHGQAARQVAAGRRCGLQVRRHLAGRPGLATVTGGPHGWSPLLYLAYARHNPHLGRPATLETARLLLDAGADPNDGRFWHALPTPFTVLTGVLGYGEDRQPWHPHASPLARLLLDRGADPNDGQTLYNRMFGSNDDHLVVLFEYGLGSDTRGPWHQLLGAGPGRATRAAHQHGCPGRRAAVGRLGRVGTMAGWTTKRRRHWPAR
jgi:hypothetical protein